MNPSLEERKKKRGTRERGDGSGGGGGNRRMSFDISPSWAANQLGAKGTEERRPCGFVNGYLHQI